MLLLSLLRELLSNLMGLKSCWPVGVGLGAFLGVQTGGPSLMDLPCDEGCCRDTSSLLDHLAAIKKGLLALVTRLKEDF